MQRFRWAVWQFSGSNLDERIQQMYIGANSGTSSRNNSSTQTEQDYWQGLLDCTNNNTGIKRLYSNDSTFDALIGWMVRMPVYDEINMGTENFVV